MTNPPCATSPATSWSSCRTATRKTPHSGTNRRHLDGGLRHAVQADGRPRGHPLGESFYRDKVDRIYELTETSLAEESEVRWWSGTTKSKIRPRQRAPLPLQHCKKDGASNYASTDLTLYRVEEFVAGNIYLTDARQQTTSSNSSSPLKSGSKPRTTRCRP